MDGRVAGVLHLIHKNRRVGGTKDPYGSEAMYRPGQGGGRGEGEARWRGGGFGRGEGISSFKIGREKGLWLPRNLLENSVGNDLATENDRSKIFIL